MFAAKWPLIPEVATTQFAVNGKIEHRQVARCLRLPVKAAPLRGRAELALDRPTHRLWDGYQRMG
jgi:hypothetical protein